MGGGGVQVEVEVGAWAAVELIVVDGWMMEVKKRGCP